MQIKDITFKPSSPYSQEQNRVFERTRRTIIDMTRATILESNIDNDLWPEIILAMTYINNNWTIKALQDLNLYESYTHKLLDQPTFKY